MSDQSNKPPSGHRFPVGVSGNPGGRPRGYERRLREIVEGQTVDGADVGYPDLGKIPAWDGIVLKAIHDAIHGTPVARQHARSFLADRLMGKPKQDIRIEDVTPVETEKVASLTDEQLEILAAIGAVGDIEKLH